VDKASNFISYLYILFLIIKLIALINNSKKMPNNNNKTFLFLILFFYYNTFLSSTNTHFFNNFPLFTMASPMLDNVQLVSTIFPEQCITVGSDEATLQIFTCSVSLRDRQIWDIFPGTGSIKPGEDPLTCMDGFSTGNGDAIQVVSCRGRPSETWTLLSTGKIQNRAQPGSCLGTRGQSTPGSMLFLEPCATGNSVWATRVAERPSTLPSLDGNIRQPVAPPPPLGGGTGAAIVSQALSTPVAPPPPQSSFQPFPAYQQQQQQQQYSFPSVTTTNTYSAAATTTTTTNNNNFMPEPTPTDHFLCTCIVDKDAAPCIQAVRAACTTGQIAARACKQSFDSGDHDSITEEILRMIDNGAKCSKFDPTSLRAEMNQKQAMDVVNSGVPQQDDHYLCVCLGGKDTSAKCKSAVKAACLVGHIPSGDCQASLGGGKHDGVTEHILRLINDGSKCGQRLQIARTSSCANPPCYGESKTSVNSGDKDLCTCLDDPLSLACKQAMIRTCKAGRIPKDDCDVAMKGNFWSGASRHALRLIDHGAQCPSHRSMSFTNRGCHCLQTWMEGDKTFTFPNNCADPGGKRGYSWCKTYADEACAGVEGALDWDRCDAPRIPVRRDVETGRGSNSNGDDDDPDHYLCVCVEDGVQDEVCVAAVRAACQVGHLPSDACKASFSGDHKVVSDLVVQAIKGGSKCALSQISVLQQQQQQQSSSSSSTTPGGVTTTSTTIDGNTKFCGKGQPDGNGGCRCFQGYEGKTCESCSDEYFGFPDCKLKVECTTPCGKGTCDYSDGTCSCPPNFVGPTCSQCAPGSTGANCVPINQAGWSFGQVIVFLILITGLAYGIRYVYNRCQSRSGGLRGGLGSSGLDGSNGIKYQPFSNGNTPSSSSSSNNRKGNTNNKQIDYEDDDFEAGIEVPAFVQEDDGDNKGSNGGSNGSGKKNKSNNNGNNNNTDDNGTLRNGLAV
jgi:hypothetical protein